MSNSSEKLTESEAKIMRLDTVFKKAIDVASNSLNNADLDECFHDIKSQYGNVLPKLFMNMIAKSQVNIEATYKDICIVRDLEEGMRSFEAVAVASSSSSVPADDMDLASAENPLSPAILLDLKRIEAEELKAAILNIEVDLEKVKEQTNRLRTSLHNELQAVAEVGNSFRP